MEKHDFQVVDEVDDYQLLALSLDGSLPSFAETARAQTISHHTLTLYYSLQCPYIPNCIAQVQQYCTAQEIPAQFIPVDSLEKAKNLPCVFNNLAVFYDGKLATLPLLNEGYLINMLQKDKHGSKNP